jgi:hypothetical protein
MIGVSDYSHRIKHEGYDKANNIMIAGDGSVTFECAPDFPSTIILGAHEAQAVHLLPSVRCPLSAVRCPLSAVRCPLSAGLFVFPHFKHFNKKEVGSVPLAAVVITGIQEYW